MWGRSYICPPFAIQCDQFWFGIGVSLEFMPLAVNHPYKQG